MTESIHIFDEFTGIELTPELRHKKRLQAEHLVYDILKAKYLPRFQEYWASCTIPKDASGCIVLIERRIHPNLEFILKNAAYYARGWSIAIVCSDINFKYCESLLGAQKESVQLISYFKGNPDPQQGKDEYNSLLSSPTFYNMFKSDFLFCMEMDTYFRKQIPSEIFAYDYIAAPFSWNPELQGSGLNYRNRKAMLKLTEAFPPTMTPADIWTYEGVKALGLQIAPFEKALILIVESCLYEDPVGVHQWWTFFDPMMDDAEIIFNCLLACDEILDEKVIGPV